MAWVAPEAKPGTCYAHWHPLEKGCVQWGKGEGASPQGKSSQQIHCCPLLEVSWEKVARRQGWRPGHRSHAESPHLMGILGHLFHSGFQWCWAGKSVSSGTQQGREFPTSMYLPWLEFQVQIYHLLMFKKQCICQIQVSPLPSSAYWHLIPLWKLAVPETISSSWVVGEYRWHCLSEGQGLSAWSILKGFD